MVFVLWNKIPVRSSQAQNWSDVKKPATSAAFVSVIVYGMSARHETIKVMIEFMMERPEVA
jgi:hypothetical protein